MSSEKGNISRSRAQKHKNRTAFKNNLHDTSHTTKQINAIQIHNVCNKCKGILEWKIKYKKYKLLKAAATCVVCHLKTIKHAYHTLCSPCAKKAKVCPKCGKNENLVLPTSAAFDESILKSGEISDNLKRLPERRKRTFHRFVERTLAANTEEPDKDIEEIILDKLKEMCLNLDKADGDDFDSDEDISVSDEEK